MAIPQVRSAAWPMAWAWIGLIVYASLHPFTDWRGPGAWDLATLGEALSLPMPRRAFRFDVVSNLLAYVPLGALIAVAALRDGWTPWRAWLLALLSSSALSYSMEITQQLLPLRHPSRLDWMLNTAGGLLGALCALLALALGWLRWWQQRRSVWFVPHGRMGMALLLSWPVALLFPPPLPLALGQGLGRLAELLDAALADTDLAGWVPLPSADTLLSPGTELLGVTLGALAPCFVGYVMARRAGLRLVLLLGALLLGVGATTLSTALNFGPEHALAWLTSPVLPGLAVATLLGLGLAWLPRRLVAALGLVGLTALVALVNQVDADPYFAFSLQGWEQGRFIRFHGVAQWVGWCWPFIAWLFLLRSVTEGSEASHASDSLPAKT